MYYEFGGLAGVCRASGWSNKPLVSTSRRRNVSDIGVEIGLSFLLRISLGFFMLIYSPYPVLGCARPAES